METVYDEKAVLELAKDITAAQDLVQIMRVSSGMEDEFAPYAVGLAIALEKLLDPVAEYIDWVNFNKTWQEASSAEKAYRSEEDA